MKLSLSNVIEGIVICLIVGFISRLFHEEAMDIWYPTLMKSSLTPPDIVFPIVWGVLYILLGVSVSILYKEHKGWLLWLFVIQMLLNITWNYLFFYLQNPAWGLINLLVLDILAVIFFIGALRVKQAPAWLFLPYLIWISFATYLNLFIFMNN